MPAFDIHDQPAFAGTMRPIGQIRNSFFRGTINPHLVIGSPGMQNIPDRFGHVRHTEVAPFEVTLAFGRDEVPGNCSI